jgi:hypothetical protein
METEITPETALSAPLDDVPAEEEAVVAICTVCEAVATTACTRCQTALCETHYYQEEGGTLAYCRACADDIVGVCGICDALHARPCRECGLKVCTDHHKRVIERWGWGGAPGQGGVVSWFPMIRTYCQEHGQNRFDLPKPIQRTLTGYDGSSPEW